MVVQGAKMIYVAALPMHEMRKSKPWVFSRFENSWSEERKKSVKSKSFARISPAQKQFLARHCGSAFFASGPLYNENFFTSSSKWILQWWAQFGAYFRFFLPFPPWNPENNHFPHLPSRQAKLPWSNLKHDERICLNLCSLSRSSKNSEESNLNRGKFVSFPRRNVHFYCAVSTLRRYDFPYFYFENESCTSTTRPGKCKFLNYANVKKRKPEERNPGFPRP